MATPSFIFERGEGVHHVKKYISRVKIGYISTYVMDPVTSNSSYKPSINNVFIIYNNAKILYDHVTTKKIYILGIANIYVRHPSPAPSKLHLNPVRHG